jgi:predicted O-methyltransferase YrrM
MFLQHIYNQPQFGENWFTYKKLYTNMVRKYPSGSTFVEIGSWKGRSAAYMATEIANSQKNIDFYCIDTWKGSTELKNNVYVPEDLYDIFTENMTTLKNYFKTIKLPSIEAAKKFEDESIDFVFIDASHEYKDVVDDILAWSPKLKQGGTLAGHDYDIELFPGVVKAACACLSQYTVIPQQKCFIYYNE